MSKSIKVFWQVIVDDVINILNINSSRGHVSRYQDRALLLGSKLFDFFESLNLLHM